MQAIDGRAIENAAEKKIQPAPKAYFGFYNINGKELDKNPCLIPKAIIINNAVLFPKHLTLALQRLNLLNSLESRYTIPNQWLLVEKVIPQLYKENKVT